MTTSKGGKSHIAALDGLRAIAVILVLLFHARQSAFGGGGFLGVDVFFVLSGFLITGILTGELAKEGRIAVGRFYLRRLFRLMPALLLYLCAYIVIAPMVWPDYGLAKHLRDAALAGTYLSDFSVAIWGIPRNIDHSWSLAVEEHFYLLWPLVLPAILRSSNPTRLLLLLYGIGAMWRCYCLLLDWQWGYYRFDTRLAGIVLGCWLSIALRDGVVPQLWRSPLRGLMALFVILLLGLAVQWNTLAAKTIAIPLVELATAVLILNLVAPQPDGLTRLLSSAPLVKLGTLSYGVYLWHFPLARVLRESFPYHQALAMCLVMSVALAWLSWHSVERFGRHLRRRFDRRIACSGA